MIPASRFWRKALADRRTWPLHSEFQPPRASAASNRKDGDSNGSEEGQGRQEVLTAAAGPRKGGRP